MTRRARSQTALFEIVSTLDPPAGPDPVLHCRGSLAETASMPEQADIGRRWRVMPTDRIRPAGASRIGDGVIAPILAKLGIRSIKCSGGHQETRLEAAVTLDRCSRESFAALDPYLAQLPALFLVSQVTLLHQANAPGLEVTNDGFSPGREVCPVLGQPSLTGVKTLPHSARSAAPASGLSLKTKVWPRAACCRRLDLVSKPVPALKGQAIKNTKPLRG